MERRFGADFARVRIHTDEAAARSAGALGAAAYTLGEHVVFGQDAYQPDTPTGLHSIAHELAHVLQQRKGGASLPGRAADHAANLAAGAVLGNRQAQVAAMIGTARGVALQSEEDLRRRRQEAALNLPEGVQAALDPGQLDREYRAELATARKTGDWRLTAEKLNGFNHEDIQARLAELSDMDVGYLHQGALDNSRLGPDSAAALLTAPDALRASTIPLTHPTAQARTGPGQARAAPAHSLQLPSGADLTAMTEVMHIIDGIVPSQQASGLYSAAYRGQAISLTGAQVEQIQAGARRALSEALDKSRRRAEGAVGRYDSQEQINKEFPAASRAAKAWAWIRSFGDYSNPGESVHGQESVVKQETALAAAALTSGHFAEAIQHVAAADAASERTQKIVAAYIEQLISSGESLVTGLTYTRNAAFLTAGVLGVVITGGAALGVGEGIIGSGLGGLTVGQTVTAVTVGAPILANVGVAGLKVAEGDVVDWKALAIETSVDIAVQILLSKFGGKLGAGIFSKLAGQPETQTLARQAIAALASGAATHVLSQGFSATVSSVTHQLVTRGGVTWHEVLNNVIEALSDPKGWFIAALGSGVHLAAQVRVARAAPLQQPEPIGPRQPAPAAPKPAPAPAGVDDPNLTAAPSEGPSRDESPLKGYYGGSPGPGGRKGMRTTPMAEVEHEPRLRPSPAQAAMATSESEQETISAAENTVARLDRPLAIKTKAAAATGDVRRSGFGIRGSGRELTTRVMEVGKKIGHTFESNSSKDGGIPGQAKASHAEKLAAIENPGKPLAVDNPMCPDCVAFFQKLARAQGSHLVVREPGMTWVFRPDGARVGLAAGSSVIIHADGTASAAPRQQE